MSDDSPIKPTSDGSAPRGLTGHQKQKLEAKQAKEEKRLKQLADDEWVLCRARFGSDRAFFKMPKRKWDSMSVEERKTFEFQYSNEEGSAKQLRHHKAFNKAKKPRVFSSLN